MEFRQADNDGGGHYDGGASWPRWTMTRTLTSGQT